MSRQADLIARCVLDRYNELPARYKLNRTSVGRREWTIVAGIVLRRVGPISINVHRHDDQDGKQQSHGHVTPIVQCISLATGMKCLPRSKIIEASGNILHDWHAEVLCMRGFNRWLLDEGLKLLQNGSSSWLERTEYPCTPSSAAQDRSQPFKLKSGVSIDMYVSAAPCGDASMELIMAAQADATPWERPAASTVPGDMLGRGQFDQLGAVRRKPSRPDAPITWSKSCSDKLAQKQCTSLLCSLAAKLFAPEGMYLSTLVFPEQEYVESAVSRSFSASGRLSQLETGSLKAKWHELGYAFSPFVVKTTTHQFVHARAEGAVPSNTAILCTAEREEVLINGVLQGRKQGDPRGASCVCRRRLAESLVHTQTVLNGSKSISPCGQVNYADLKQSCGAVRSIIKDDVRALALHPWKANDGDSEWLVSPDR